MVNSGYFDISDKIRVHWQIHYLGQDVLIILSGGDAHIGSVSYGDEHHTGFWARGIHKEYHITKPIADVLTKRFPNRAIVVVAGMHYDNLTPELIEKIINACLHWAGSIEAL
jgi:hypothetical protein